MMASSNASHGSDDAAAPVVIDGRQVFVRMYRGLIDQDGVPDDKRGYAGLLGDCFMIRVVDNGTQVATILIDCGILLGSADAVVRMRAIANDIKTVSGGCLDLLVVTHEHWDHISGFAQAQDILFDTRGIIAKSVWLAWTEDPGDTVAQELTKKFDRRGNAFAALAQRMDGARDRGDHAFAASSRTAFDGLDAFLGPALAATPAGLNAAATRQLAGKDIMDALSKGGRDDGGKAKYLLPGMVTKAPGGLRTYVLGPPKNTVRLFKDKPSSGEQQETYLTSPHFENLLMTVAEGGKPDPKTSSPFSRRHQRIRSDIVASAAATDDGVDTDAGILAWLKRHYLAPTDVSGSDLARRRVDGDWLGAAGALAMKLDSDTNNTSLVLAFELPDDTMMLFPGDAQVGNWLSWHDQKYQTKDGTLIDVKELLGKVRFYKVGHHGSHNATLEKEGLELMTRDDLVAAIPTDEAFGKKQGSQGWQMPNPRVKTALLKHTDGRIFRNDARAPTPDSWSRDPDTTALPFPTEFVARLDDAKPLYLEYRIYGEGTRP